jgi:hypothetical protein
MAWAGIFHPSSHPDMLWDPNTLYPMDIKSSFFMGKAPGP